jgi:hypothetical protein
MYTRGRNSLREPQLASDDISRNVAQRLTNNMQAAYALQERTTVFEFSRILTILMPLH